MKRTMTALALVTGLAVGATAIPAVAQDYYTSRTVRTYHYYPGYTEYYYPGTTYYESYGAPVYDEDYYTAPGYVAPAPVGVQIGPFGFGVW